MCSCGLPHMANQKQEDELEHSYSSYVMIRDVILKTCRRRWMIGRRGERGSGISVLAARHDDDDEKCLQYFGNVWHNLSSPDAFAGVMKVKNHTRQWEGKAHMILFTNPSARAGYETRSIFKRSLTGFNSEFSFS